MPSSPLYPSSLEQGLPEERHSLNTSDSSPEAWHEGCSVDKEEGKEGWGRGGSKEMEAREDCFLPIPQAPLSWNCVDSGSHSRKTACLQPSGNPSWGAGQTEHARQRTGHHTSFAFITHQPFLNMPTRLDPCLWSLFSTSHGFPLVTVRARLEQEPILLFDCTV